MNILLTTDTALSRDELIRELTRVRAQLAEMTTRAQHIAAFHPDSAAVSAALSILHSGAAR